MNVPFNTVMKFDMLHAILLSVTLLLVASGSRARAQGSPPADVNTFNEQASAPDTIVRSTDSSVQQAWKSHYGYSMLLPNAARFNKLGSTLNPAGQSEVANFILPGGCGSITLRHFAEGRMIPKGYAMLDSIHVFSRDSVGRNGMIFRRIYMLTEITIEAEVLLTPKGQGIYKEALGAIFDSFIPPPDALAALPAWRYGRDPREFEHGRSPEYHLRQK